MANQSTLQNSRVILGLDFGTTFSGVSWAFSGVPDTIKQIVSWDNEVLQGVGEQVKVPSKIHYPSDSDPPPPSDADYFSNEDDLSGAFDTRTETTWGYGVPTRCEVLQWFKLLLLDDEDLEKYLSDAALAHLTRVRRAIQNSGREVLDIIRDYLRLLWKHVLEGVAKSLGRDRVEQIPFTVVVTVPAVWKGYVRSRMRMAIKAAGILDERAAGPTIFQFVSEPEAAALATLTDLQSTCSIRKGDCLTVVDIGGGTGDLISYQVTDDQKFAVTEIVEGQGGLCGAIFLDQAFIDLLIEEIGEENWNKIPRDEVEQFLYAQWERGLKRLYKRGRAQTFRLTGTFVQVTGKPHIHLDKDKLLKLFTTNPVVTETIRLVKEQVEGVKAETGRPPKYIAMVGGFGSSRFLKEELEALFGAEIDVLQDTPERTWSAISRGAVMSAAKGLLTGDFAEITSRVARANYGFVHETKFEEGKHKEEDRYYNFVEGRDKAKNQTWWFLKKGEKSSENHPLRFEYERVYQPSDRFDYPDLSGEIWTYPDHNPPTRVQDGVTQLCEMKFTAPKPFDDLPEEQNARGLPIKVFVYAYEILSYGDSIDVTIFADGEKVTGKNIDIDYELDRRQATFRPDSRLQTRPNAAAGSSSSSASAANTNAGPSRSVGPSSSGGTTTPTTTATLPATPESEDDLYDNPVEPPPPSYTPYSSNPFADPPTSPSVMSSSSTTGFTPIPTPPPLPPLSASSTGNSTIYPQSTANSVPPVRTYLPYRPPVPPAVSSLTPVLAPTATPLVNAIPLPPHLRASSAVAANNNHNAALPLRPNNSGTNNPFSQAFQPAAPLGPQLHARVPPPPPPGFGPGVPGRASTNDLRGPALESPPSSAAGDRQADDFVVLDRRASLTSIRTANSALTTSGASQRSRRRVRPLSSFLRRRRDDDSDSD